MPDRNGTNPLDLLALRPGDERTVILAQGASHSADEILGRAAAIAERLRGAGAAGRPVVINLDAGVHFAAGLVGSWIAGSTPVLLDPLARRELDRALVATKAAAVIQSRRDDEIADGALAIAPNDDTSSRREPAPPRAADRPMLYLFTSGSTGTPALVPKTFEQIDVERRFISELLGAPPRAGTLVPWCHIFGFLFSFVVPLRTGGVCDLVAGISPRTLLDRAAAGLVDLVVAVPSIYRVMIRLLEGGGARVPEGCRFVSSGAPLSSDVRRRFQELTGARVVDFYGSTEAGGVAYRTDDGPWLVEPHVRWRIAKGGYLEVGSASVSAAGGDGYYRLGDLVSRRGDGFVLAGRADDVVKIGGRRLSLDEIQGVLERCPGVSRAAALARPLRGELRIVACVVPDSPGAVDGDAVKAFVRARLADHKVPRLVLVLDSIPVTAAGKIDRRALEAIAGASEEP